MLARSLDAIVAAGVRDVAFVIGYCGNVIRSYFGAEHAGARITYIEAKDFATTNNIVSLWAARDWFRGRPLLLLEGDLVYDPPVLARLISAPAENVALVDRFGPGMSGSVILADGKEARVLVLGRDQGPTFDYTHALKTINIYRFAATTSEAIASQLDAWVAAGRTQEYYEAAFAEMIASGTMRLSVLEIAPQRWAEIDTLEDLRFAEKTFA